jgi:membrane associated rhomboid family serine protease
MGIYSRDYIRETPSDGGGGSFGGGTSAAPICKLLIIATVVVFVPQMVVTRSVTEADFGPDFERAPKADQQRALRNTPPIPVVEGWLDLDPQATVYQGQIWRLLTHAFCHDRNGVMHIVMNMLLLWWFGSVLEQMYGSREFLLFYLTGAIVAGVAYLALAFTMGDMTPAIGASGAVMAVMMVYAIHFPRRKIYLFFVIPVEIRWLVAFYVIYDLYPVLVELGGGQVGDHVAHSAHLGGLAFGYLYHKQQWRLDGLWKRLFSGGNRRGRVLPSRSQTPNVRLHQPRDENLDAQVDTILAKISREGEASLTSKERDVLTHASREYRDR